MTCFLEPRTLLYPESPASEGHVSTDAQPHLVPFLCLLFLTCSLGTGTCGEMGLDLVWLWRHGDLQTIPFNPASRDLSQRERVEHSDSPLLPTPSHYPRCSGKMVSCLATAAPPARPWTVSSALSR